MSGKDTTNAVANAQHSVAFDGDDETGVGAGENNEVGRLVDAFDQGLHVRGGDVTQQGDRRIRRAQGSQCESGTVGAVAVLPSKVAIHEHGQQAVSG